MKMKAHAVLKSIICALLLLGMQNLPLKAQVPKANPTEGVAAAVELLRTAMIDADSTKLSQIVSDHLSYGHSSGVVQDKQAFIHALVSGASNFVTIELTNQTIQVSGSTAIVRHVLSGNTNDGGKPGAVKLNILLVWQKVKGNWLLLARQAFKMPIN